jgi:filamentous hemagglutinin family protein
MTDIGKQLAAGMLWHARDNGRNGLMKHSVKNSTARKAPQARRGVKFSRRLLPALIAGCFAVGPVWANPTGAQIVSGQVSISNNGRVLTVTNSPGSIINWQNFSIGSGELTQFLQQSSSSAVLNRIVGQNPSQIFGALQSNGKVYLINPNGIMFGAGSQVNVASLVASSVDISNADFTAGKLNFSAPATATLGSVVNQGSISTPAGGSIYLIAPQVQNSGILTSPQGEIYLAAGHSVQLVDGGDPNLQVVISAPTDQALNLGQVVAQGGKIGIYGALVNQNGVVNADSAVLGQNGEIVFKSSQTTMLADNSVTSAQGTGGGTTGGTIYLEGPQVGLTDTAQVNASGQGGGGTVLVGGGFHGTNAAVENANEVYIGAGTSIKADATASGNGGKVAVWSQDATRFYGDISAQGGKAGGNGGYVETSSDLYLDFRGYVDLKAPAGAAGTLLLDPYDLVIDNSTSSVSGTAVCSGCGTGTVTFSNPGATDPSHIGASYISSQLATGNVTVSTLVATNSYITVNAPISWNSSKTLTLAATGNIAINSYISGFSGGLVLNSTGGNISQSTASTAFIQAASLSATATTGNVNLVNGFNSVGALSGTSGGYFTFNSNGNISVASSGISAGGAVTLNSYGGSVNTSGATISGSALTVSAISGIGSQSTPLSTAVGTLTATNGGPNFGPASGGGDVVIANNGSLTIAGITQVSTSPLPGSILVSSTGAISTTGPITNANTGTGSYIGLNAASGISLGANVSTAVSNGIVALKTTGGNITQSSSGGGNITSAYVSANAPAGSVSLYSAGNAIGTIAGAANSGFYVANTGGIAVGTVNPVGSAPFIGGQTGITSTSGNIGVNAGGSITISNNIGTSNTGTVALNAGNGGNIVESGGVITAGYLSAAASGYVSLQGVNHIAAASGGGTIAGYAGGSGSGGGFNFRNSGSFYVGIVPASGTVGSIPGRTGINAGSSAINLTSNSGYIGTSGGAVITTSGTLTVNAYTGVGSQGNPLLTSVGTLSVTNGDSGSGGGDGVIAVLNSSGSTLTLSGISANNSNSGGIFIGNNAPITISGSGVYSTQGDIALVSTGGIAVNAPILTYSGGNVALQAATGNITQSFTGAGIKASGLSAVATAGYVALNSNANSVGTIAGSAGGYFSFFNSTSVTVGSVAAVGTGSIAVGLQTGIATTAGNAYIGAAAGDITVANKIVTGSSNYVSLNSAGSILSTQSGGSDAIQTGTLYLYDYTSGSSIGTSAAPLLTAAPILASANANSGGLYLDNTLTTGLTVDYVHSAGPVTIVSSGPLSVAVGTAGSGGSDFTHSGAVNLYAGYTSASSSAAIQSGNNTLTTTGGTLSGTGINLYAGGEINGSPTVSSGISPCNYTGSTGCSAAPPTTTTIYLTVSGETATNKTYNGSTVDTLTGGTLSGVASGDSVTLNQTGNFANANVGNGKAVTAADTISVTGDTSGDVYVLVQPTGLFASITPASLYVTGQSAANKVYNGNTAATLSGGALSGTIYGNDVVTLVASNSGAFASKNVGNNISVSAQDTLSGTAAGNYTLVEPTLAANITPLAVTVSGQLANNKIYDGTAAATLSGGTVNGVLAGDSVTLVGTGSFPSKNVGANLSVTASDSLGGVDGGNYVVSAQPTGLTANITPLAITVAATGSNKVYNGTTADVVTLSATGVLIGDSVTFSNSSANFDNANVGTGKTVTVTGIGAAGADAGNYSFASRVTTAANITPATLTVSGEAAGNRTYNGNTTASLYGGTLVGVVSGDSANLTLNQGGNFSSAGPGNNIAVVAADSLTGSAAGNYTLQQPGGLYANIYPQTLLLSDLTQTGGDQLYIVGLNYSYQVLSTQWWLDYINDNPGTRTNGGINYGSPKLYCN